MSHSTIITSCWIKAITVMKTNNSYSYDILGFPIGVSFMAGVAAVIFLALAAVVVMITVICCKMKLIKRKRGELN